MKLGVLSLRSLQSGWDEEATPLHEIERRARGLEAHKL